MPRPALVVVALVALSLVACRDEAPPVESAGDLVEQMRARYLEDLGGMRGFSVLLGGFDLRHTRTDTAGRFTVSIVASDSATADPLVQAAVTSYLPNVPDVAEALGQAPLGEAFEREGARVYALDASPLAADSTLDGSVRLVLYVDARTFRVREVERTVRLDSLPQPLTQRTLYDDYRTTDGVTLPWRVRVVQSGIHQLFDQAARMVEGGQLTFQRAQLQAQPPSPQRNEQLAAVERRIRAMTQGTEEVTAAVRRVVVQGG